MDRARVALSRHPPSQHIPLRTHTLPARNSASHHAFVAHRTSDRPRALTLIKYPVDVVRSLIGLPSTPTYAGRCCTRSLCLAHVFLPLSLIFVIRISRRSFTITHGPSGPSAFCKELVHSYSSRYSLLLGPPPIHPIHPIRPSILSIAGLGSPLLLYSI